MNRKRKQLTDAELAIICILVWLLLLTAAISAVVITISKYEGMINL